MNWFFNTKVKKVSWEEGFLGRIGVVISDIQKDDFNNGLITVERDGQLFHFYAVCDENCLSKGTHIEIVGFSKNNFVVKNL